MIKNYTYKKNKYKSLIKVILPSLLFLVMLFSLFSISNNTKVITSLSKVFYEDNEIELDNWEISTVFYDSTVDNGNTPLTEINWDASDGGYGTGEKRKITVQIYYKNTNTVQDYNPGDLEIKVDNIINKYKTYQWDYSVNAGANDSTHVGYEWNFKPQKIGYSTYSNPGTAQEKYIFTNANKIEKSTTLEGTIQIEYSITPAQEVQNASTSYPYEIEKYENSCLIEGDFDIVSSITDKYGNNTILANPISFSYTREYNHVWERRTYTAYFKRDNQTLYSEDMYGNHPEDYIWIPFSAYYGQDTMQNIPINIDPDTAQFKFRLPEGAVIYNKRTREVLDQENSISPSSGSNTVSIFIAYPKSLYNTENNNMVVQNYVDLYGVYYDRDNLDYLNTANVEIDLRQYAINPPNKNHTIEKRLFSSSSSIYYQGFLNKGNSITWEVNSFSYNYEDTYNLKIGDDLLLFKTGDLYRQLNDDEYVFTSITIPSLSNTSGIGYSTFDINVERDLYVRKKNQNTYEKYDTYTGNEFSSYNFTSEEEIVGWYIIFKDVPKSLKFNSIYTTTNIKTNDIEREGTIYNFDYVEAYKINEDGTKEYFTSSEGINTGKTQIDTIVNNHDLNHYSKHLKRDYAAQSWQEYQTNHRNSLMSVKTTYGDIIQNEGEEKFVGSFKIGAQLSGITYDSTQYTSFPDLYSEENTFKGYIIYDLLPTGMELESTNEEIINSTSLTIFNKNNTYSGSTNVWSYTPYSSFYKLGNTTKLTTNELKQIGKNNSTVEVIKNWKNTGRTMLKIKADFSNEQLLYFGSSGYAKYCLGFDYTYKYSINYDYISEYGFTWTNESYVDFLNKSKDESLAFTIVDNGNANNAPDINSNGDTTDLISKYSASTTINSIISTNQDVQVSVQSDKSNFDTGKVETSSDSEYKYKLRARTGTNDVTNLVIYDSLENYAKDPNMEFIDSSKGYHKWKGEFLGIDTSYAESKGYTIRTYYSESDQPGSIKDDDSWVLYTDSVDKTKVKSLAFEYLDNEGNPAVLPANSLTYVLIRMKSPNDENLKTLAYNGCWTEWNAIDSITGRPVDFITGINSNIVKVALPNSVEPQDIDLEINKYWKDKNNSLGIRPETINIQVIPDGDLTKAIDVPLGTTNIDPSNSNHWKTTISVPKTDLDGNIIAYTIREDETILDNGYKYTPEVNDNSITNTLMKEIELKKIWKDNTNSYLTRPSNVTYKIKQNNNLYREVTFTGDYSTNEWTKKITVPVYDNSNRTYNYTIEENQIDNYTSNCSNYTCTNTLTGNDTLNIKKNWVDNNNSYNTRPSSIMVNVLQNNTTYRGITLTSNNNWTNTITVPKYDSNGVKYNYTIEEDQVNEYDLVEYNQSTYNITNTLKTNINLTIKKNWVDDNNSNNTRPNELKITLLQNDNEYRELTLTGNTNTWTTTIEVPKYDNNQRKYTYSIREKTDNLNSDYSDITYSEEELSVTNKLNKKQDLMIKKKWIDQDNKYLTRPSKVNINILRDGEIFRTIELSGNSNTWTHTINDVDVYDSNGRKYNYTLEEETLEKYGKVTYDNTNLEVTNELTEIPKVTLYFTVVNGYVDPVTGEMKYDDFGLNEIMKKYNINPEDEYIFTFELQNTITGQIYEGKLSTQGILEFDDLPYGEYKAIEGDDKLFEFVDMLEIEEVNGVKFEKRGKEGYITIEPTGENIMYGAKIINKIEAPIVNPKTNLKGLFLLLTILIITIISFIFIKKKKELYN